MGTFRDGLRSGIRGAFCRGLNQDPQFISNLEDAFRGTLFEFSGDRLNQIFCDRPADEFDPDVDFPVTGGQCSGITYQVQAIGTNTGNGNPFNINVGNFPGPIRAQSVDPSLLPPSCPEPNFLSNIEFVDGNGSLVIRQSGCAPFPQDIRVVCTPLSPEPTGGCGDGPPLLPSPGNPVTIDIDITYGDTNEFNLTVPLVFAPVYVDLDGTFNIPFTIEELDLVGELALNGDFEVNFDFGGNNPPNTGDDGPEGEPDPDGGDPDDEAENDRGAIVGVFVVVTSLPANGATFIPQSAGPSIVAPRAGSVKFKVSANGRSGWSADFPVKSSNAWIPVPGRLLASDVQVTPDFGAELSFSVVRERPRPA